ncbi:MAG: DUF6295 family protein [Candidatus Dormibacteria bacterium]
MCTYITEKTAVTGSAKGRDGWFSLTHAMAYVDHPYHASLAHALNIDFIDERQGASARVAVELSADSARALVRAIETALEQAGPVI